MAKPHLTLVNDTGSRLTLPGEAAPSTRSHMFAGLGRGAPYYQPADQLVLPFDEPLPPALRILIVAMDSVHGRVLNDAIIDNKPRTVLDLRHVARFNQRGSDRDTVFGFFAAFGSYYLLQSMPWHTLSARDFMAGAGALVPRVRHELIEREQSPVMLFVPRPEHATMLSSYLNRLLSEKSKVTWQLEQVW